MEELYTCVIADDEPNILASLKAAPLFPRMGIRLIAACDNGEDALDRIITLKPDFAIVDIRMPKLTGLDILKRCADAGSMTSIIIISGFDTFAYAKEALKYGAKAYVLKPIDYDELAGELSIQISKLNNVRKKLNPVKPSTTFFKDLIEGRVVDSLFMHRILSSLNESITDTSCCVVTVSFTSGLSNMQSSEASPLVAKSLERVKSKFWFQDPLHMVIIVNIGDETPFAMASGLLDAFRQKGYPDVYLSVGDVVPGLYQCSYSYNRALMALSYKIYFPDKRVFTTLDICTATPTHESPLVGLDIEGAILSSDPFAISNCVHSFISNVLYVPAPSPNYLYSYCNTFAATVTKIFHSLLLNADIEPIYRTIPNLSSIKEITEVLIKYLTTVSGYILSVYGRDKAELLLAQERGLFADDDEIIRKSKLFIKENIGSGIQISDVASSVNLSASYFAIYFKNKTGVTLRDYILSEKMEWACRLLLEKNANVEEIAERLGYSDYHAFSRAFKKKNGQTPSSFMAGEKK